MKNLVWIFTILFFSIISNAAWVDSDRQELAIRNVLKEANPGFENGLATWVVSGASPVFVSSGANLLDDKGSVTWNAAGAGEWLRSKIVSIPKGLYGMNGLARIKTQVPSGTATHLIQVWDGSNVIAQASMASTTTPTFQNLTFVFPSSGSISIRFLAQADEPLIAIDSAFIGDATNILNLAQAEQFGTLKYTGTSNCIWTSASGTFANFSADTDCATPTVTGNISAPATKIPGVYFANMPPGKYVIQSNALYSVDSSATQCGLRFHDGTNAWDGVTELADNTTDFAVYQNFGVYINTVARSNVTLQLQGVRISGSGNCDVFANTATRDLFFHVNRFPIDSQQVVQADAQGWFIDANISGANPDLGTSNQSSYVEITNSSLTMVRNNGSAPVGTVCSSTNPSIVGNLTCAAGNEGLGVTFNLPRAGTIHCASSFANFINPGTSNAADITFQLVETPTNAQTILQEGNERIQSGFAAGTGAASATHPNKPGGYFTFNSSGQKALRVMYEQILSGSPANNLIIADADASVGQRDFNIKCQYVDQTSQISALWTAPKVTSYSAVGSGTFNVTGKPTYMRVRMVGAGGGGAGSGAGGGAGGTGTSTTFGSFPMIASGGGAGANNGFGGAGGSASFGTGPAGLALDGGSGQGTGTVALHVGGNGGGSAFGGAGGGGYSANSGFSASPNTGSGGGGGGGAAAFGSASGGGAGGFIDAIVSSPSGSYSYFVGTGGSGGAAGTGGGAGGNGSDGLIIVEEHYQ